MRILTNTIDSFQSDVVVLFVFENEVRTSALFQKMDEVTGGELAKQIYKYRVIKGKYLETFKIATELGVKILVVGLGKRAELTRVKFSQAVASSARIIKTYSNNQSVAFELIDNTLTRALGNNFSKVDSAKILLCAARIGLYQFDKYLSDEKKSQPIEIIELVDSSFTPEIEKSAEIGAYTSYAMKFAKDLINESAQIVTPNYIANLAAQIAKEHKLEINIFNKEQVQEMGMNAFLAVGQGSVNEPKFIHLIYKPSGTPRKKIALVGKGITFDAGGMNIKPATSMLTMKSDMSGVAVALGVVQAIAKLKVDIELHVVSALCENMTSGSAYKQGDVLTAMNGKTIEIDNTDAEGRITLADALTYCDKLEVDEVIDVATLTGACIVALGTNITGVMGNNQSQINKFVTCARKSCEYVWQMPILEEMKNNLKSEIADMKNTGGRNAGTSIAAWFLSNFTKSKSWMHLDIAGTAYLEKTNGETISGPTGVMIRSLVNYFIS